MLIKVYLFILGASILTAFTFAYPENPPVAHTGGFGEPTCHTCHFDGDLNDGLADLSFLGLESTYLPGQSYAFGITLKRKDMHQAGFQLSIRDTLGHQAGTFVVVDARIAIDTSNDIQYVRHSPEGTELVHEDSSSMGTFTWVAPDSVEAVYLHLSTLMPQMEMSRSLVMPFTNWRK